MKKRFLALFLGAAMTASILSGCGGSAAQQPAGDNKDNGAKPENKKYALFMSHMTNAFTQELSGAVQAKANELGVELTIFDGKNDAANQISQVESAVNQGYAGLMIEPISVDGIKPAVQTAKDAGIPVVTVNQKIAQQELASAFVGVLAEDGGAMEMQKAVDDLGGKGNVVFLYGPMGSDAQIGRAQGYKDILAKNPDVKVVYEQTANWATDEALKLMENWLQTGKEINAVVAQNDNMALGALKAIEDAKMQDKIKVYGLDATDDALAAIKDGRMTATVSQSTLQQGSLAMETCYKIVKGESVPAEVLADYELLTKDKVDDFMARKAEVLSANKK